MASKKTNVWETIMASLNEDEDAAVWQKLPKDDDAGLPSGIHAWQINLALMRIIRASDPPKRLHRRLVLAVIHNSAINADETQYRAEAAKVIRLLLGRELLQDALDEAVGDKRDNLAALRDEVIQLDVGK